MSDLRARLRALPTFPDDLPVFNPATAPDDPYALFGQWLDDAIASRERQPNAMTVSTMDTAGGIASRTLIIKDVDERGFQFSSARSSRKGEQLASNPTATMLFFWRALGRQVEVAGCCRDLGPEVAAADWAERPNYAGDPNPDWAVWALDPIRFEFLQATHDRKHVRVEYQRAESGWSHRQIGAGLVR